VVYTDIQRYGFQFEARLAHPWLMELQITFLDIQIFMKKFDKTKTMPKTWFAF
jgi:hypothetical protein